jgi:hypothetical protein
MGENCTLSNDPPPKSVVQPFVNRRVKVAPALSGTQSSVATQVVLTLIGLLGR